jgi:hypothetical protein
MLEVFNFMLFGGWDYQECLWASDQTELGKDLRSKRTRRSDIHRHVFGAVPPQRCGPFGWALKGLRGCCWRAMLGGITTLLQEVLKGFCCLLDLCRLYLELKKQHLTSITWGGHFEQTYLGWQSTCRGRGRGAKATNQNCWDEIINYVDYALLDPSLSHTRKIIVPGGRWYWGD